MVKNGLEHNCHYAQHSKQFQQKRQFHRSDQNMGSSVQIVGRGTSSQAAVCSGQNEITMLPCRPLRNSKARSFFKAQETWKLALHPISVQSIQAPPSDLQTQHVESHRLLGTCDVSISSKSSALRKNTCKFEHLC